MTTTGRNRYGLTLEVTLSFVIRRRKEGGNPSGLELAFHADTEAEALAEYEAWSVAEHEGLTGTGKSR
jgi:hypothetical protein